MKVILQGPSYAPDNRIPPVDSFEFDVDRVDIDYGLLTVYPYDGPEGVNMTLAVPAQMVNEEGEPLGEVGWRIQPSGDLLGAVKRSEAFSLKDATGYIFGRILIDFNV